LLNYSYLFWGGYFLLVYSVYIVVISLEIIFWIICYNIIICGVVTLTNYRQKAHCLEMSFT